ncbi:DNA-binding protein [Aneurinibacillus migulanus]|uniref:helix-turn-helix transcriptional regulator n=1 Tax=Aneurinibacillus migulanus TaxID=47500 RepID=UPI0005BB62BC|nr:helix-turn-helix transcriptional regulator [Aneurinibacillus migulanus]KIV56079.1 DNA-binding protein [Aneurinibacillus migulanus]KPD06604.1 DNA-binding protein [Aneurinibacillus migulanus]
MESKLRELRLKKGITQTYMAKSLGFKSVGGYNNIEMGRTRLSLDKAKKISEILGVGIEDLFFEEKLHIKCK